MKNGVIFQIFRRNIKLISILSDFKPKRHHKNQKQMFVGFELEKKPTVMQRDFECIAFIL